MTLFLRLTPIDPNASLHDDPPAPLGILWVAEQAVVDRHDPNPLHGTPAYRPVTPTRRRPSLLRPIPALFQINQDAISGISRPSGSVGQTSRPNRTSGSLGNCNTLICFQPDHWVQAEPLELPHHDRLDYLSLVRGRHDRIVNCRNERPR